MSKPKTVPEYIQAAPKEAQKHLREIRTILKKVAPKAKEAIKWGYPVFEGKRILFSFSGFKSHINFMPTRTSLQPFKKDLAKYKTGKDTIQFPLDQPLPKALIKKVATYRVKEVKEGSLWMHSSVKKKNN
jgi:uncharacterized protein YdhG (YjbR/CyaY superfamily)